MSKNYIQFNQKLKKIDFKNNFLILFHKYSHYIRLHSYF